MHRRTHAAPALVLFDIDGTLIRRAGPHHREALIEAIRLATGLATTTDGIPLHGMLDPDIVLLMMRQAGAGVTAVRRALPFITRKAESLYARACPSLAAKVCPGARRVLARLRKRGVRLGLVTGNFRGIGWTKLERAGLDEFFEFGAFGGMSRDRAGLARLALSHARRQGWIEKATPVSLVGDAPSDIRAARANRVRAVAVATGVSTPVELARCKPHLLLKDLRELKLETLLQPV